jgi:tetratricopeptide (TPR) repeat protein
MQINNLMKNILVRWRNYWAERDFYAVWLWVSFRVGPWWTDRKTRYLLQGLPALIVMTAGVLTFVGVFLMGARASEITTAYQRRAEESLATQPAEALTCYERLVDTDENRLEHLFGLAQACEKTRAHQRALGILNQLAPLDRRGYAPAHKYLAQVLLSPGQVSAEALDEAECHLVRVLEQEPDSVGAHVLLAQIYLVSNRLEKARPHLIQGSAIRPEFHLTLARLYNTLGRKASGVLEATRAEVLFRARAEADSDDHEARLNWAQAAALLGKHAQAAEILREGLALSKKRVFQQALAQLYVAWSDALTDDPTRKKLGDRLALIDQGLRCDPNNLDLLARLQLIARLQGSEAEKARSALQDLLAHGQESAALHLTLGIDASERGQVDEAALHFERAFQLSPETPLVANNLAWSLSTRAPIDLPRALRLADSAIRQTPALPQVHGTRGHILFKMERWKDALPELLLAARGDPRNAEAHDLLASIYTHLNDPTMAKKHRELADLEKKGQEPAKPVRQRP